MALGDFFLGTPARTEQFQKFNPEQQQGIQQLIASLQGNVQNPTQGFAPIEQQARSQFSTQTIPGLAERFTSLGSGGSQRSSAFQGALGQAGAGLEQGLASLKSQYGLQRQGQAQSQLGSLLTTPTFDTARFAREPGFLENLLAPLIGGLGQGLTGGIPYLFSGGQQQQQYGQQGGNNQLLLQLLGLLARGGI